MKLSKVPSLIITLLIYIVTITGCYFLYPVLPIKGVKAEDILVRLVILNLIATVFIFIFSLIFKANQIFNLYWNVAPSVIVISYLFLTNNINVWTIIPTFLVLLWSIRGIINYIIKLKSINQDSWRILMLKNKFPRAFYAINFFGLHILVMLVLLLGVLPVLNFIGDVTRSNFEPTPMTIVAFLITLLAIIFEILAEVQLLIYKAKNKDQILDKGLWKASRHPNYFFELLFFFSLFLIHFSLSNANVILIFCPMFIFLLYVFLIIPVTDKYHAAKVKGYDLYISRTNPLLPIFPPKQKEVSK